MTKQIVWYEVFIDMGEKGTMPITTFTNKKAAIQYAKDNKECDGFPLKVDKWTSNGENGHPEPVELIYPDSK